MKLPTVPTLIEKVSYKDYNEAYLFLTRFYDDDKPVLFIGNDKDETVYNICNINISEVNGYFNFAIKNYSENIGIFDFLFLNNFIEKPYKKINLYNEEDSILLCEASKKLKDKIIEICENRY